MKNNPSQNKFYPAYLAGFFLILALPLLVIPPWFYPPDWGKTIIFRSVLSLLIFLFAYQFLFIKREIVPQNIKNSKIIWVLALFFIFILISTLFSAYINFSLWGSPYRAGGAINLFFYIMFAVISFLVIKKSDWTKILNFSIFIGMLVCLVAVIQLYGLFSNIFIPIPGRPPSTMGNPILLGIYLLLLFFLTFSFAIQEKRRNYKLYYYFAILLFVYVILITGSRAAYLGLLLGGLYFALFYPKKLLILKLSVIITLALGIFTIYYINSGVHFPKSLENNKIFQAIQPRLSLELALTDPRFSAWKVGLAALKERPTLGWGPENFAIGFDKYYDPSLPYISKAWGGWWDRPHNIFLDIATSSGIPSLIIYITLFITLFWQLQKLKYSENTLVAHGVQTTLIAYLTANTFSFDGFSSYLLFFLLIGYSLHLTSSVADEITINRIIKWRKVILIISTILITWFLWQYNIKPLQINAKIQKASFLSESKKCDQALSLLDNVLPQHSFLDAYTRIKYIEYIKTCAEFFPEKNLAYAQRGAELMKEAIKIRPLYSRLWLFLGSFTTIKANAEQNPDIKEGLIKEANSYFDKASGLAPKHQEVLVERAKLDMIASNYQAMKEKSEKCIILDSNLGDCYWIKTLSEIYLQDFENAKKNIEMAKNNGYNIVSISSLHQLVNAYVTIKNYTELAATYRQLIKLNPDVPDYHSSLAFTYSKTGEYKKAREEALIFLKLMPEAKEEVDAFLRTLPR